MDRDYVSSSAIESIGYEDGVVEVVFWNGGVYQYFDIPQDIYEEWIEAFSIGEYYHCYIRGQYPSIKVW